MAEWYIQTNGKKYGPFDSEKLVKLAAAGKLTPTDRVRKGRDGEWKPASSVRRLFDPATQANYSASQSSSSSKRRRKSTSRKRAKPAAKSSKARPKPRPPAPDPLFDLSEEVAAAAPLGAVPLPTATSTQPQPVRRSKADPRRNIGVTLAKLSWQMPIIVFGFGFIFGLSGLGEVPLVRFVLIAASAIGFFAGPTALCLMAKYGSEYILTHALIGTGLHLTCCLGPIVLITVIGYQIGNGVAGLDPSAFDTDNAPIDIVASDEPIVASEEPYLERRAAFTTKLTQRGPASQEYEHERPPEGVEEVTYPSGSLRLKAWVNRSGARLSDGPNPALVYFHGGFTFGASDMEACQPFVDEGLIVMTPMLRGENGGQGNFELFMGEVDDAKAAVRWLAKQPDVDPDRIYTFGHSVGGGISAMLSLMDDVPIRHGGSSGGLYGLTVFDDWSDIVPFDPNAPHERELRLLLGNIRWMKHEHFAYLGDEDVFGVEQELADKEWYQIHTHHGATPHLTVQSVAGDHFTSFYPAVEAYLNRIRIAEMKARGDLMIKAQERNRKKANRADSNTSVPNPFRPKDNATTNPFEPKNEVDTPFDPAGEVENPFDPKDEVENPFEPKDEPQNPFEPDTEPEADTGPKNPFEPAIETENPFE